MPRPRKLVYVCSRFRGATPEIQQANYDFAVKATQYVLDQGHIPLTPHVFYSPFFNEAVPEQREKALELGQRLILYCDEIWVFTEKTDRGFIFSDGMFGEFYVAMDFEKPITVIKDLDLEIRKGEA